MPAPQRLAIGYARVSTTKQADDGVSLEAQQAAIEDYCARNGLRLTTVHVESASGKDTKGRPELEKAIQAACDVEGVLVFHSLTRLARSIVDAVSTVERLERCGADIASTTEANITTYGEDAMGEFVFGIFALLGQLERKLIVQRTKAAMDHKRAKGERISRHAPYGYQFDENNMVVAEPNEQKTLKRMKALRKKGLSLRAIAAKLDEEGRPPRMGKAWSAKVVMNVLRREATD